MLSLKSRKLSLGILAAVVIIDWYVGMQAPDNGLTGYADSPHQSLPHLPTLRIVPMSPLFATDRLFNFAGSDNGTSSFHELQALLYTTPLQIGLSQLARHDPPVQQPMDMAQENVNAQIMSESSAQSSGITADTQAVSVDSRPAVPEKWARAKADTPQAANLLKLLALYSMLHR
ncbi:MAG: hypothetical protein ACXU7H_09300 [Burkholderiaceae bacterium]